MVELKTTKKVFIPTILFFGTGIPVVQAALNLKS